MIKVANYLHYKRPEKKNTRHIDDTPRFNASDYREKIFAEVKTEWRKACEYWKSYPDRFIDFISTPDTKITLFFYQRIFLRIFFRYRRVFLTATRGTAKSWTAILAIYLQCMFYPGLNKFICAPGKQQAAKIAQDNIEKIWEFFPILKGEIEYSSFRTDYTRLVFRNGSRFDVVQARDSERGGRRHGGMIDEIADERLDGDMLHSVVIPLMANSRIAMCGGVDPNEIHKQEIFSTTAGTKQSFAFKKMQEVLFDMATGGSAFALGCGYELPCMHNLLDINFVNEQKESPNFSPMAFQREYESIWTGSSTDSLVSLDDLNKCRVLVTPEDKAVDKDAMYVLSYDVARAEGKTNAQSALIVIKVKEKGDGTYTKHLVNIYSFEGTHFAEQALFLKRKVNDFNARILCVDINGLGIGCVDYLVTEIDENPAYEVVNDDRYNKYRTPTSIPMVFAINTSSKDMRNSDIHNIFVNNISNQKIKLLKSESSVKSLFFEKKGMTAEKYSKIAMPFVMTDILCDEIMNLEYRQAGNETKIREISKSINKDKFSALEYGLFWIYLEEQKNRIKRDTTNIDLSKLLKTFKMPSIRSN